jgi:hypothetical protein
MFLAVPQRKKRSRFSYRLKDIVIFFGRVRFGSKQEYIARDLRGALTAFLVAYAARDEEVFRQLAGDYWSRMTDGRFLSQYR